ncbi:MAG TPA: hypothetical protein VJN96_22560 [Vicinamibacterales bacterium]|nr:hypothetical protein [Vicinamibacterales bacterium]
MSLERTLALAIVAIWLVVAVVFAVRDAGILLDPVSRRMEHVCTQDLYPGYSYLTADLDDKECLPRIAMRAGFDVLMVGLPLMAGIAIVSRGRARRFRHRRRAKYAVLSSSVSHAKTSRFPPK